jgi:hypothetical protein
MGDIKIRKQMVVVEDTLREVGQEVKPPQRKVAAIAVIENPYAGKYVQDLSHLIDFGAELGGMLAKRAVEALGVTSDQVKGYGKGAIVGSAGELEHAAALIHPKFGKPIRDMIGGGKAIIPSTKKRGGPGTRIDVPVLYKDDEWSSPYLDAMEVGVPDAPGPDEVVVALVMTNATRPLSRVGPQKEGKTERDERVGH